MDSWPLRFLKLSLMLAQGVAFAATGAPHAAEHVADTRVPIEQEPIVDAATLVQAALLSGPGFSVDTRVQLRGYMARFTLDTPFGPLSAESVEILAEREAEMPALAALDKVTRSSVFLSAAGNKFVATGKMIGQIVMHPLDTVLGIPAGVARYFGDRLHKIGTQAQTLSDRTARTLGQHGNPYPVDEGPMTDARQGDPDAVAKPKKHWYTRVGSEAEREIKRQVAYNTAKRDIAKRLGIDPYTTNPYIQERLSTSLIDALGKLRPANGCDALLELGMTAGSELEGRFLVNALQLVVTHLGARAKDGTLQPVGAGLTYVTTDGELILPLPVDRLSWTAEVRDFLDRPEFRRSNKTVLIGGNASLDARRALVERAWNIIVRAPWPSAPPYAQNDEPASIELGG